MHRSQIFFFYILTPVMSTSRDMKSIAHASPFEEKKTSIYPLSITKENDRVQEKHIILSQSTSYNQSYIPVYFKLTKCSRLVFCSHTNT